MPPRKRNLQLAIAPAAGDPQGSNANQDQTAEPPQANTNNVDGEIDQLSTEVEKLRALKQKLADEAEAKKAGNREASKVRRGNKRTNCSTRRASRHGDAG